MRWQLSTAAVAAPRWVLLPGCSPRFFACCIAESCTLKMHATRTRITLPVLDRRGNACSSFRFLRAGGRPP